MLQGVDIDMRLGAPLGRAADSQPDDTRGIVPRSPALWQRSLERLRSWRPAPRSPSSGSVGASCTGSASAVGPGR